jgi:hypothetical protein
MDDLDPHAEEMLEKSLYIVDNLAKYVDTFNEDQLESIILMQQSMDFYIKQDNMNKAIIECRNLYNKIQQIIE